MRESWRLENVSFDTLEYLARLEAPAGYVLVAQDIELSKRYRIEQTSDPKQRLDQMREFSPVSLEVVLILQTEDAKATENFLHELLRRNRRRGNWFALEDTEAQRIRNIAWLEDPGAIAESFALLALSLDYSVVSWDKGSLLSLPPKDYRALPPLTAPAGYICVIRDIDSDYYRVDKTHDPSDFIIAVLSDSDEDYGIELLSIVRTDDLPEGERFLYEQHDAMLGATWLDLDSYQLQELRDSALQINAHSSLYLTQAQHHEPDQAIGSETRASTAMRGTSRSLFKRPASAGDLTSNRFRRQSRRRSERQSMTLDDEGTDSRKDAPDSIIEKINDMLVNRPGETITFILVILVICLAVLDKLY